MKLDARRGEGWNKMNSEYVKNLICFDFDGVFHQGERELKEPLPGILDCLTSLVNDGYHIVILSARNPATINKWLTYYDFPIIPIYRNKPPAFCYVDDRAVNFNGNYSELISSIKKFNPWWNSA